MKGQRCLLAASALCALAFAGCQDKASTEEATSPPTSKGASPTFADASTAAAASGVAASDGAVDASLEMSSASLSDDQILGVTHIANTGEIEQAKIADSKARDARVKSLAAMMLTDHTQADSAGASLGKKDGLTTASSSVGDGLQSGAEKNTALLRSKDGDAFDSAYVQIQIDEHQEVLDTIDGKLLPAARNADLKALLTQVRAKVAMHLDHAKQLQSQLRK